MLIWQLLLYIPVTLNHKIIFTDRKGLQNINSGATFQAAARKQRKTSATFDTLPKSLEMLHYPHCPRSS